ncbi:ankyrin repeat protein [Metarhizium guizhouense ARSEF 977]|uniref:Ankyrin repeat protein n=1 Tax=Metarhizium guizhouense (strain ARSEF 977) TaxID=1276136 RepID=A0A0B4G608_METGA|nr:ankyrin repeat protein [Metarhizium guizhouense ARSEF 977]
MSTETPSHGTESKSKTTASDALLATTPFGNQSAQLELMPQQIHLDNASIYNFTGYELRILPTPRKACVETPIPIKIIISSLPPGVTRLHLPSHTISKPKFLARSSPERSSNTLELQVSLVCSSAMMQVELKKKALERAATVPQDCLPDCDGTRARTRSSATWIKRLFTRRVRASEGSSDSSYLSPKVGPFPYTDLDDAKNSPQNGGDVRICTGCIKRERKQAARKEVKKPEEEDIWSQDEERRVVVFNTRKVEDWQPSTDFLDPSRCPGAAIPPSDMQIDGPMRIG